MPRRKAVPDDRPPPGQLDAEAARLWAQVTATVTPLAGNRAGPPAPRPTPGPAPRPSVRAAAQPAAPTATQTAAQAAANPPANTLDASWDRRLSSGRLRPDLILDLHGLRRDGARQLLHRRVAAARAAGLRTILVITGKGSLPGPAAIDLMQGRPVRGAIRAALPRWLAEPDVAAQIAAVRRAHPRHGGAGAVYLILKRQRG